MADPVKRSDWQISPFPAEHGRLPVELSFTAAEFEKVKQGRRPREMGDQWFIFFEEPWLYLHRSMTGACMFQVRIEPIGDEHRVSEALVDRDCSKSEDDEEYLSHWLYTQLLQLVGRHSDAREHFDRMAELTRAGRARDNPPMHRTGPAV